MTEQNFTDNQKRAINDHGMNYVVVASAGAGKTRVLVERYLSLLTRGLTLPSIVAITFTEKAASEMRDRVRRAIEERAKESNPSDGTGWVKHLSEIDAAQISTIHSLCARLLRANPAEAHVDPRFQVIEEIDATIRQEAAVDAVLTQLTESGGPALALLTEYEIKTIREILGNLFKQADAANEAFAQLPENGEALLRVWQTRLQQAQQDGITQLLNGSAWQTAATWICNNSGAKRDDKLEIVRADMARLIQVIDPVIQEQTLVTLQQLGDTKVGNIGTKGAWDDVKAARQIVLTLRDLAKEFKDTYVLIFDENDRRAAERVFQWRELWLAVRSQYAQAKSKDSILDFNDLEEMARSLLLNHSSVRERYRAEFACVLVDEFQDTNAAQRDIIYALAAPDQADRLFVVADGKQSIYGFRGADVSVFTETKAEIRRLWGEDAIIPLAESFRAHDRLGRAFNDLFARIMAVDHDRAPYEIEYEPMRAVRPSLDRQPIIEIVQIPEDEISEGERREREAAELAQRMRTLVLQDHFQVWDKETKSYRDTRWGDIALLFRATTHFITYEDAFKIAQIPYVTMAGKGYYDRPEVRDLIQLLRALDSPQDDLALATVLRSPLYALSDETLYRLRRNAQPFRDVLKTIPNDVKGAERARVEYAYQTLEELWMKVGRVPILDLLKGALEYTGYPATLTALTDGERRRANVEKLLALARRTGLVRLTDFNAYLQDLTAQEVREGEAVIEADRAVRLMSIHRAKGLEFPIVIIPDASRAPWKGTDAMVLDREGGVAVLIRDARGKNIKTVGYQLLKLAATRREDAEEKRLFYVAATRAQDYLIVSGGSKAAEKSYFDLLNNATEGQQTFDWGILEIREPSLDFLANVSVTQQPEEHSKTVEVKSELQPGLPRLVLALNPPGVRDLISFTPTGLEKLVQDRSEFERRVLEGSPDRVTAVSSNPQATHVPAYIVGEMAHRAIQRWRFPGTTPTLVAMLKTYAEEYSLTDPEEIQKAVREAVRLLENFVQSGLFLEMEKAQVRRTEVPFVAQWQGRIVHGALDALCQAPNDQWFIVDFKTDRLREKGTDARLHTLSKYGVQIALYQQALAAKYGEVPVHVHYIREGETVVLSRADLVEPLARAMNAITA